MGYFRFDEVFDSMRYPAGESHVRLSGGVPAAEVDVLEVPARNFEDLCQLLTADRIFARQRCSPRYFIPYFPFARHDRRNDAWDGLELEVALALVQRLDVTVADPHSDVSAVLRHIPQRAAVELFAEAGAFENDPVVVIPDQGATKKSSTWAAGRAVVQASKRRDVRTGELSGFHVDSHDLQGRPCIIVDDICDAGGTFIGLAQALKECGAGSLTLAVTHGLFTRGLQRLTPLFDRIYCCAHEPRSEGPLSALPYRSLYQKGDFV